MSGEKPIGRRRLVLSAALLASTVVGAVGCTRQSRGPSRFDETPARYWTALEAYERIKPVMLEWNEDAHVVYLFAPLLDERPGWGLQPDGRVPRWTFVIDSPSSMTETGITIAGADSLMIGLDGHPERAISELGPPLPMGEIKDSDIAIEVAREAGISLSPYTIESAHYDPDLRRDIPLSWMLVYTRPEGGEALVFIDAVTGELIRNGFAE
jgi:hypothetical protein